MAAVDDSALPSSREAAAPLVAALATVALWASAFVGIRSAGTAISPGALTLGRLVIGGAALAVMLRVRGEHLPSRATLRPALPALLACGLLWFGAYNIALNAAERRVDAGTAAMLVNVGPVLIAILAGVLLREGFPRMLVAGCAIAFSGVVVIGIVTSTGRTSTTGVALCLVAAGAYASGVVAQKPVLRLLSPLQTTLLCCIVASIACLPFAPSLALDLSRAGTGSLAWLVYLGLFPTALAFTTWAYALARTDAGRLAATTYLVPPLSILLGWTLLGEAPPLLALAGGALCLVGVGVSRRR